MENDQRLTPLPFGVSRDIQPTTTELHAPAAYNPAYDNPADSRRSIRQYVQVVYKRLPLILVIAVIVTAATAFYMYRQPTVYSSSVQMTIEPRKPASTRKDAAPIINFGDDRTYYNTQLQLMRTPDLMQRAIVSLGLHRDPSLDNQGNAGLLAGLRSLFSSAQNQNKTETQASLPVLSDTADPGAVEMTAEEKARATRLANGFRIDVQQTSQTNIVTITVQNENQILTQKVADRVAVLFKQEDVDRELSGARDALNKLNQSIDELNKTIYDKQSEILAAQRSGNIALIDKGSELRLSSLQTLLDAWRQSQIEVSKLQQEFTAANSARNAGEIMAMTRGNAGLEEKRAALEKLRLDLEERLRKIDDKIDEKQQKRRELLAKYTEEYREVKAVDAEIKELEAQKRRVDKEVTDKVTAERNALRTGVEREVMTSLGGQLRAAQDREAKARALYETESAKANIEGQFQTKLKSDEDVLKQNRDLLSAYIQRQKEQELALATEKPDNIKIQSAASPAGAVGPQRTRNIMVAFLLSLAVGIGLAFLLDYLDDSVRTSDDISRHLGLPTLALIPEHTGTEKRKLLPGGRDPALTNGAGGAHTALITMGDRTSPMAEAYRHLRTSLLFSSAGKPPQTILITSSQPSEGKTTTAINTAITLAQSDADVVIVDCDLRRPRLHNHFGMDNTRGLTNYLSGDKDTDGLIRTFPDLPKLKIITSGPIPPNPAELLSSNEMRNLLQFLSGKFKHVIIDSPPAISFTDASILATQVDGVVLVAMANKSSLHLIRQFKQRVSAIGARIYGVVLNGLPANSQDYYYYYGSGYSKYYANADDDGSTPYLDDVK